MVGDEIRMPMCVTGIRRLQLPLTFRPGNRYRVTVRALRGRTSATLTSGAAAAAAADADADAATFDVVSKGSTEFRTGEGQYRLYRLVYLTLRLMKRT